MYTYMRFSDQLDHRLHPLPVAGPRCLSRRMVWCETCRSTLCNPFSITVLDPFPRNPHPTWDGIHSAASPRIAWPRIEPSSQPSFFLRSDLRNTHTHTPRQWRCAAMCCDAASNSASGDVSPPERAGLGRAGLDGTVGFKTMMETSL
jgi:hypothetical protein